MAKITATLSIGLTFRNAEEITEVEKLQKEIGNTWTHSAVYLAGLRHVAGIIEKAKAIIK